MQVDYFCRRERCDYLEQTGTSQSFCMWTRCPYKARIGIVRPDAPKSDIKPASEAYIAQMEKLNNHGSAQINHRFSPDEVETIYRERRAGIRISDIAERHGWTKGGTSSVIKDISHGGGHYRTLIERGIDVKPFGED